MLRQFLLLAVSITASAAILAAEPVAVRVPAGDMAAALESLAKQTRIELIFQPDDVKGLQTSGVSGMLTPQEAAATLIRGTRLTITTNATGAILIAPPRPEKGAGRPIGSTSLMAGDVASQPLRVVQTAESLAAQNPIKHFDIKKGSLDEALKEFQSQSRLTVVAPTMLTADKKGKAVHGDLTPTDALGRLLKGSGLTFERAVDGTMAIRVVAVVGTGPTQSKSQELGPDAGTSDSAGLAEILVKGSRIMNVDVTRTENDAQPYYIFDSEQIEQSGAANVEDFLTQQLTMNTTFQTNSQLYGNVALTTSSINLRGLGTNETLILIDGRRSANVAYGADPTQPDVNGIPMAAIERIEVLPSSASAIYGGAAVGGVVNIILKKDFNGGEFGYSYDEPFQGHAPRQTINAVYGFSLDNEKTRVMLSGSYSDGEPLLLQERLNLVGRGISSILSNSPVFFYNPTTPFPGATPNIAGVDANGNPTNLILKNGTPLNSPITYVPAGSMAGSNIAASLLANAGRYNLRLPPGTEEYALQNQLGVVPTTKALMATVRQKITDSLEAFAEFSTTSNAGRQLYNPFGGTYSVPAGAPTNPFQESVNINFPSALSLAGTSDSVTQSDTVGLIARLPHDWSTEVDYTWSRNSLEAYQPEADNTALGSALAAGTVNPFVDTIASPLSLARYLGSQFESPRSTLNDIGLRGSGPLGSLPWGNPVLTVGLEHRKEGYGNFPSGFLYPLTPANDFTQTIFGQSQDVNSIYAEADVPLVTAKNVVPGVRSLDLQLAGRTERYTVLAGTQYSYDPPNQYLNPPQGVHDTIDYTSTNPTIGIKYRPVEELTLRASYATAFLPPLTGQLLPNPTLLCGPTPCMTITDPRNGLTYEVNETSGGNPNLQPQTSRDVDFGMIWEPIEEPIRGLRIDLQYYRIVQPNYITGPTLQQVVSDPALASRVTRDPKTGLITSVNVGPLNATEYKTNGWDFSIAYRKETPIGNLGLRALGTWVVHDLRQIAIGTPFLQYAGFPADGGEAKIKANATLSWEFKQWNVSWTTVYVGGYQQADTPDSPYELEYGPFTPTYTSAQGSDTIPSQMYHNLFVSFRFKGAQSGEQQVGTKERMLSNLTVQIGIKNIFNTLPPFDAYNMPYFYSSYGDPRLRDFRLTVKKGF